MKIKIIKELPVLPEYRPEIGSIHEVVDGKRVPGQPIGRRRLYFIMLGDAKVGVYPEECELVEEDDGTA